MKGIVKLITGFLTLMMAVSCLSPLATTVYAKDQSFYKIKQVAQTETGISIDWTDYVNDYLSIGNYTVTGQELTLYEGTKFDNKQVSTATLDAAARTYTFEDLNPGTMYTVEYKMNYSTQYSSSDITSSASIYTLPGKVTGLQQEKWWYWAENCDVIWDFKSGVDGYEYVVKNNKNKEIEKEELGGYSNRLSFKIDNNYIYTVKARAFTELNGEKHFGKWSDTAYCFTQPMVNKASYKKGKLNIKWNKVKGCDEYEIYASTKEKEGYKKLKKVKASQTSLDISKINGKAVSSKKTYYFYIVGIKNVKGKKYTSGKHYTQQVKGGYVNNKWTF